MRVYCGTAQPPSRDNSMDENDPVSKDSGMDDVCLTLNKYIVKGVLNKAATRTMPRVSS